MTTFDFDSYFKSLEKDRTCPNCNIEYFGSKSFCSNECMEDWRSTGPLDPWRKYCYPPYQPVASSKPTFLVEDYKLDGYK